MRAIFPIIAILLIASLASAQLCHLAVDIEITPKGPDAEIMQSYFFDCANSVYLGQATNIRLTLPEQIRKVAVSDSQGLLEPAPLDPAFYKLTAKEDYSILSIIPRNSILVAPFGNTYFLTTEYVLSNVIDAREDTSSIAPSELVIFPELRMVSGNTVTSFRPDISAYSIRIKLPEGAELKKSGACTVEGGIVSCSSTDPKGISGLEIVWRDKTLPENLMRKGWPWFVLSLKNSVGGLFGFLG